jgi:hypothetical protein
MTFEIVNIVIVSVYSELGWRRRWVNEVGYSDKTIKELKATTA